jgi:hypothetical protein
MTITLNAQVQPTRRAGASTVPCGSGAPTIQPQPAWCWTSWSRDRAITGRIRSQSRLAENVRAPSEAGILVSSTCND